jgi:hypothetical protein
MSLASLIKTVLEADNGVGGVDTLLTGGIYTFRELDRHGISRTGLADAFDADGILQPCLVIRQRSEFQTAQVADEGQQLKSTAQSVELYFYDDGDTGYSTIDTARTRTYTVLSDRQITGSGHHKLVWQIDLDDLREPDLEHAAVLRADYRAVRVKGS